MEKDEFRMFNSEIMSFDFENFKDKKIIKVDNTIDVKITHENGYTLIEFETKMPKFKVGEWVKNTLTDEVFKVKDPLLCNDITFEKASFEDINKALKKNSKMLDDNGNIVDWKQVNGETCFIPCLTNFDKYQPLKFISYNYNQLYLDRGLCFPTKELAIQCTEKMLNAIK